jgi:hypothetical protein
MSSLLNNSSSTDFEKNISTSRTGIKSGRKHLLAWGSVSGLRQSVALARDRAAFMGC